MTCSKIRGKGPKRLKTLKNDRFHTLEHFSLPIYLIKQIKNNWTRQCSTLKVLCSSNIKHSLICPKTWGKRPKRLKELKIDHFSQLSTTLSANFLHKTMKKAIGHATTRNTLIYLCRSISNICQQLTCTKICGRRSKRRKTKKNDHEHTSLPTSLLKQNKNNWALNHMWPSYSFVQF